MSPQTKRILRKLDDKQRYRLIEIQNQLLTVIAVLLVVLAGIQLFRAVQHYRLSRNCFNMSQHEFNTHHCESVVGSQ